MSGHWIAALLGVLTVLAVSGVGFAAFSSVNTVNGTATATSVAIQMTPVGAILHHPGHADFSNLSEAKDQVTLTAWDLVAGDYPHQDLKITNVGTGTVTISVMLWGDAGLVATGGTYGYDVYTDSGLSAVGGVLSVTWVTLHASASHVDRIFVGIPADSTGVPLGMSFTVTYTATASP